MAWASACEHCLIQKLGNAAASQRRYGNAKFGSTGFGQLVEGIIQQVDVYQGGD
jgi:hypothetical protein